MTHRQKSIIICLVGLVMAEFGWVMKENYTFAFGSIIFTIALLVSLVKHEKSNYPPIPQSNQDEENLKDGMDLSELIKSCMDELTAKNIWPSNASGKFYFFELSPNINTSGVELKQIGKIHAWRADIAFGRNLDDIDWSQGFFGDTPEEAVANLLEDLTENEDQDNTDSQLFAPED